MSSLSASVYHAPRGGTKSSKTPVAIGLGVALMVHAGLAAYLITQQFIMPVETAPPEPIVTVAIEKLDPPTPKTDKIILKPVIETHLTKNLTEVIKDPVVIPHVDVQDQIAEGPAEIPKLGETVEPGPVSISPHWRAFPDGDSLERYYPAKAAEAEVEGAATVECQVLDIEGHVSCRSISEKPEGYGFGKASVAMIEAIGRVDTDHGRVKIGSVLRQTVAWRLP